MKSHTFSIIFKSSDWAGQRKQLIRFLATYSCVDLARWTGRCRLGKNYPFGGKCLARTSHKFSSKMSWYLAAFMFPSTGVIVPTPSQQMKPHIMTSYFASEFCFSTRSGRHPSSFFLQIRTLSSWPIMILLSSEKITRFQFSTDHCLPPDTTQAASSNCFSL